MDTIAISSVFAGACVLAVLAFVAHARLAGTGERAGCVSLVAFAFGWLFVVAAFITGVFLISLLF